VLISTKKWSEFTSIQDFKLGSIKDVAKEVGVPAFIIIERLQKEKLIPYTQYSNEKVRYKWN